MIDTLLRTYAKHFPDAKQIVRRQNILFIINQAINNLILLRIY